MRFYLRYTALLLAAMCARGAGSEEAIARIVEKSRLVERMKVLHVPAVSIAVVDQGKIVWATAWGGVNTETVFQAASISKPVAAMAALHMSQNGNFTLDEDVNGKLKSWKVPENQYTASKKVTLRGLLSHSAGMTVSGFPGYEVGKPLPTLLQILNGEAPANTAPIRVDIGPGSKWRYSGGGFTVMQQLLMDRVGWSFPDIMQRMVLSRIGMKRSSYAQPIDRTLEANAATAHDRNGNELTGKWHVYPEMAAAGLWTTPSDLALWAIELRNAWLGRSNRVLEQKTAREMVTRQSGSYGLGVGVSGQGASSTFSHGGENDGFKCMMTMVVESGQGMVIMTNGDRGAALFQDLERAVASEYHWPQGRNK